MPGFHLKRSFNYTLLIPGNSGSSFGSGPEMALKTHPNRVTLRQARNLPDMAYFSSLKLDLYPLSLDRHSLYQTAVIQTPQPSFSFPEPTSVVSCTLRPDLGKCTKTLL